ncbi:MAG: TSUP family transporter [Rhodospirillales bacterium]|nr:TSUP family transporter [Rhodospirillales bacterium]
MISLGGIAALLAAVIGTSFISGVLSLAGGTILMGVFVWVLPVSVAMILHGVTQIASNGTRAWIYREHIQWNILGGYLTGAAACLFLFAAFVFVTNKILVFLLLGILPFANFLTPRNLALDITKPFMPAVCGFTNVGTMMLAGVSGPLLDVFFVKSPLDRFQVHATKGFTQVLSHTAKVIYFVLILRLVEDGDLILPLWVFAAVVPLAYFGNVLARRVVVAMSDHQFRWLTQGAAMAIGAVFLYRAFSLMSA